MIESIRYEQVCANQKVETLNSYNEKYNKAQYIWEQLIIIPNEMLK